MAKAIPIELLPVLDRSFGRFPLKEEFSSGLVIAVDKPLGWSSFDVVRFVRHRIPIRKVGHAGTLDPMASGLLLLCCGKATKSVSLLQDMPKEYLAKVRFGTSTLSYDSESMIDEKAPWEHITLQQIQDVIKDQFLGSVQQVPPIYSALHINGERMYKLARRGEKIDPVSRSVMVYDIELLSGEMPEIELRIRCGKGFYVRSLAHDLGKALGTVAHLSGLSRTAIGSFLREEALSIDEIREWGQDGQNDPTG
ncbi:MAG: tRNA pseudouridine(55) synthase TruB [Balneolaceae bacterium]